MANPELLQYIKTVQVQGFSESTIREALVKSGWPQNDIDEAFRELNPSASVIPSIPVAPVLSTEHPQTLNSFNNSIAGSAIDKSLEYNSPFSIGLAIILFGTLMVLINKIIDDSALFTASVNGKLIFDAVLVVPFLLIAFMLHGSLARDGKRYLIISQPYFVTAAFLVVRLLWDTSAYILNANAAYGVYVVLLLVIAVLTGIIIFVQKYIKN